MSHDGADNSDMELENNVIQSVPIVRNLMRPSYRWVVAMSDVLNDNDGPSESEPNSASDSDIIVVSGPS